MTGGDRRAGALDKGEVEALSDPRLGVVVITRNRRSVVDAISRLLALPERPPVAVVDNGSDDGTPDEVARLYPSVVLIRLRSNRGSAARNVGVAAVDRPYVAFCDDDVWWEPGSLRRGADLLDAHPRLAVVTARILVGEREAIDATCVEMASSPLPRDPSLPGVPVLGFLAGASIVRRTAFVEAGGFEPRYMVGGEEELLALRLAERRWALAYVDDLVAHHHPSPIRGHERGWIQRRNALWTAWMRRPVRRAVAETMSVARDATRDQAARTALREASAGALWALRRRRVLPSSVERKVRLLEKTR